MHALRADSYLLHCVRDKLAGLDTDAVRKCGWSLSYIRLRASHVIYSPEHEYDRSRYRICYKHLGLYRTFRDSSPGASSGCSRLGHVTGNFKSVLNSGIERAWLLSGDTEIFSYVIG